MSRLLKVDIQYQDKKEIFENDLSNSERERQTNYETWRQLLWFQKSDESRGSWTSISRKEREEQTNYENWRQH